MKDGRLEYLQLGGNPCPSPCYCRGAYQGCDSFEVAFGVFTFYYEYFGAFENGTRGYIPFFEASRRPTVTAAIDYANKQLPTMLAVGKMVQNFDASGDDSVVADGCEPNVGNDTDRDHN